MLVVFCLLLFIQNFLGVVREKSGHVGSQELGMPFLANTLGLSGGKILDLEAGFVEEKGNLLAPPRGIERQKFFAARLFVAHSSNQAKRLAVRGIGSMSQKAG